MDRDEKYDKLIGDVKYKIMDVLDSVTEEYMDGFIEAADSEIADIKNDREFWKKMYYRYMAALGFACKKILTLQGYSEDTDDFFIEKQCELEKEFLEMSED